MKRLIQLSFVLLLITAFGCSSDSNIIDCTSPPVSFAFEFIDKDSGENLYTNGTFDAKQAITVTDMDTKKIVQYAYIKSDNLNRLSIDAIGFQSGTFNYEIKIENKSIFELHVSAERLSKNGCSFSKVNSFEIKNAESKLDKTNGVYKIRITTKI